MEGLIYINEHWHGSNFLNTLFKCITFLGEAGIVWIVIGIAFLCFKKTRTSGIVLLVSLLIGFCINDFVLKNIIARPRPFAVNTDIADFLTSISLKRPSGFSMPSGHSYVAFNAATMITLFYKKKGAPVYVLSFLIAFSRIFLCVHYPTDVLVGSILGVLTAVAVFASYKAILRKTKSVSREKIRKNEV